MEQKQYRYPGTRPFAENDRHLFFGRNSDIKQLSELIALEKLVVLFSKSGYGKSSLLNAGVIPRLSEKENHKVINIRLNEKDRNPVKLLVHHLKSQDIKDVWLSTKFNLSIDLPKDLSSNLWYYAKSIQLANTNCKSLTLVFDQFEELFNYNNIHVQEFSKTIATLLNLNMPKSVRLLMKQKIKNDANYFTDIETDQLLTPINLKVVFSLRNDRLSLLNQLKTYLPAVFKKTYELQPLDEMQALEALLEPAMKEGSFASPVFSYSNTATKMILDSLKDIENQRIETFQLQLICQHAEELIIRKVTNHQGEKNIESLEISESELGKPEDIFEKHYKIIINNLPKNDQYAARILIEDKLIVNENRVPLPETVITQQHNIASNLLKVLVDKRLLRSEPNTVGGTSYELSHDTLVAPITKAAEVRRHKEEEARIEAQRQEEIKLSREKAEKERKERLKTEAFNKKINSLLNKSEELLRLLIEGKVKSTLWEHFYTQASISMNTCDFSEAAKFYHFARLSPDLPDSNVEQMNSLSNQAESCVKYNKKAIEYYRNFRYKEAKNEYKNIKKLIPDSKIINKRIEYCDNPIFSKDNLVRIKGGSFIMGDCGIELPELEKINKDEYPHKVNLSDFYLNKFLTTNEEFAEFVNIFGSNKIQIPDGTYEQLLHYDWFGIEEDEHIWRPASSEYSKHPVIRVTWYGAKAFCDFWKLDLPTEAQWEYSARNRGENILFSWGNDIPSGKNAYNFGNIADESLVEKFPFYQDHLKGYNTGFPVTSPVGSFAPNKLGLFDMSGNAFEWCEDFYHEKFYEGSDNTTNPINTKGSSYRCIRGGNWRYNISFSTVLFRGKGAPAYKSDGIGFRYGINIDD